MLTIDPTSGHQRMRATISRVRIASVSTSPAEGVVSGSMT